VPGAGAAAAAMPGKQALDAATAAADSLQDAAAHLPDMRELEDDFAPASQPRETTRIDALMAALWRMADDLALIRVEFQTHTRSDHRLAAAPATPPPGGIRADEVDGILAQIDAVEASLIAIVAVLTEREAGAPALAPENAQEFLERVAQQQAALFRKSGRALCQLRLQAIQLSASVHAFRNSLALAGKAIARAKR